jgi:hypothetical protein
MVRRLVEPMRSTLIRLQYKTEQFIGSDPPRGCTNCLTEWIHLFLGDHDLASLRMSGDRRSRIVSYVAGIWLHSKMGRRQGGPSWIDAKGASWPIRRAGHLRRFHADHVVDIRLFASDGSP